MPTKSAKSTKSTKKTAATPHKKTTTSTSSAKKISVPKLDETPFADNYQFEDYNNQTKDEYSSKAFDDKINDDDIESFLKNEEDSYGSSDFGNNDYFSNPFAAQQASSSQNDDHYSDFFSNPTQPPQAAQPTPPPIQQPPFTTASSNANKNSFSDFFNSITKQQQATPPPQQATPAQNQQQPQQGISIFPTKSAPTPAPATNDNEPPAKKHGFLSKLFTTTPIPKKAVDTSKSSTNTSPAIMSVGKEENKNSWMVQNTATDQDPYLQANPVKKLSKKDRILVWFTVIFALICASASIGIALFVNNI